EFQLANSYEADELAAVLRQQLGSQYLVEKMGFNLLRICGLPLLVMMFHALLVGGMWFSVNPTDGVRRRGMFLQGWLQDTVGSTGVMLFAAVVGVILLLWMLGRFIQR